MNPISVQEGVARRLLMACVALQISSCAFQGEYRGVQPGSRHASLTADKGASWRDRGPTVFAIDGEPTTFWRTDEEFRLLPGETVLTVIADKEPYEFSPVRFSVDEGCHYHLRYGKERQSVLLYDVTNAASEKLVFEAFRKKPNGKQQGEQAAAGDPVNAPN